MSGVELTDEDCDNIAADVYARAMVDLAREHPGAEGITGRTDTLVGGVASLTIWLRPGLSYSGTAGPEVKRPRSYMLAQIVSALAHDVGGCDCRGRWAPGVSLEYQAAVASLDKADAKLGPIVCPAATDVIARCKAQIADRLGAAAVIKSLSVFAKP